MKWYSVKKYSPSFDGHYIVRWLSNDGYIGISYVLWSGKVWLDFDESNHQFKGEISHFAIPSPVEIEE